MNKKPELHKDDENNNIIKKIIYNIDVITEYNINNLLKNNIIITEKYIKQFIDESIALLLYQCNIINSENYEQIKIEMKTIHHIIFSRHVKCLILELRKKLSEISPLISIKVIDDYVYRINFIDTIVKFIRNNDEYNALYLGNYGHIESCIESLNVRIYAM